MLPDGLDSVVFDVDVVVGGGGGIGKIITAFIKFPLRPPTSALT